MKWILRGLAYAAASLGLTGLAIAAYVSFDRALFRNPTGTLDDTISIHVLRGLIYLGSLLGIIITSIVLRVRKNRNPPANK